MDKIFFGKTKDGIDIYKYILKNSQIQVGILNYGGIITEIFTQDRDGIFKNIVLNFDNIESYEENSPYYGCITGRNAGRIKDGKFKLNETEYQLGINNGDNHLHGGVFGLHKRVWTVENYTETSLSLQYTSPHLEEGYPGEVNFQVEYSLEGNALKISYIGIPDRDTIITLTNHSYFNLSNDSSKPILDHKLKISSDKIATLDKSGAVTSKFLNVEGTPFDFRTDKRIGEEIEENHSQLIQGAGYDHPFILNKKEIGDFPQIVLKDSESGRVLEIRTSEKVVVLYTGNFLSPNYRCGVCLETQNIPNYINFDNWGKEIYNKENIYKGETIYTFSVEK